MSIRHFLFSITIASMAVSAEVSVFGAGDLNSDKPYGLTKTEEHILKNKKTLGNIDTQVKSVSTTIESINERIDGLESIYEGDAQKMNQITIQLKQLVDEHEINKTDIANLKEVTSQILTMQEEISTENKKNIDELKKAIAALTKKVNQINASYISDKEFEKNMKQFVTRAEFDALKKSLGKSSSSKTQAKNTNKKVINKKLSPDEASAMFTEAKRLFKKDYFTKAIPMFETLIANNYKPATSNFYLGEMWYYRKKYKDAISYFKTSATLYDKASYMPKLLLHSAISFEKTGDLQNAANFYSTLIDNYPTSEESNIAYKNLSKIQ